MVTYAPDKKVAAIMAAMDDGGEVIVWSKALRSSRVRTP
jgi:uncharacterized protein YheU (UPF0270 family)